jgi:hypothetical protein
MYETNHRPPFAAVALLTGAASVFCQSPAGAAEAPRDACGLLTQAQVSAALGIDVDPGKQPIESDPLSCNWREKGRGDGIARNVLVYILDAKTFDSGKQSSRTPKAKLSGIGDEAYLSKPARFPANLSVRKGEVYFRVMARSDATSISAATDHDQEIDKALAVEILKKL